MILITIKVWITMKHHPHVPHIRTRSNYITTNTTDELVLEFKMSSFGKRQASQLRKASRYTRSIVIIINAFGPTLRLMRFPPKKVIDSFDKER
jgi:hypothetical protein